MKRVFCFLAASMAVVMAFCADVIITTKSEKLEVKIVEISSTEVKYKKINNLQGPTFVISTNEINTIMYENGDVQVMEHRDVQPTQSAQTSQPQQVYGQYPQTGNYQQSYGNYGNNPNISYSGFPGYVGNGIVRNGSSYYYKGQQIVLQDFLYQTCPVAYDYWRKNFIMECAGWGLLGAGVALVAGTSWNFWPIAVAGGAFVCAGVPLATVGNVRRCKKAPEIFNQRCAGQFTDLQIKLQTSQDGVGLAFCF